MISCRDGAACVRCTVAGCPDVPVSMPVFHGQGHDVGPRTYRRSTSCILMGCEFSPILKARFVRMSFSVSATAPRVPAKPRGWGEEGPTIGRAWSEATGSDSDPLE